MDERTLKREGVCAASLPTTMVRRCFYPFTITFVLLFAIVSVLESVMFQLFVLCSVG